jgi:formamidopyrimidine-DNA glycosylase
MFELPEVENFVKQINATLKGKTIRDGSLGNSPHKFVWYNRKPEEFKQLVPGKKVGRALARGRWLFIDIEPGYVLVFGEMGGRLLYHPAPAELPKKYHLHLEFDDGSYLSATTQMWGAMELYQAGDELNRQYVKDMRPTPIEAAFTFEYFNGLIDELLKGEKRSVKSLLTQDQIIPGLGNSIAQDIMFRAGLYPRHSLADLPPTAREILFQAIRATVGEAIEAGGRSDELDLFNRPGCYQRLMDNEALKRPCPRCGGVVEKMAYLGGNCYYCPACQK